MTAWKPGDVAVRYNYGYECRSVVVVGCSNEYHGEGMHWHHEGGGWDPLHTDRGPEYRPLVVLDPEDREQAALLLRSYGKQFSDWAPAESGSNLDKFQAALRSLVAPPKPDEPTGLGAVVEDDKGRTYIRTADTDCRKPWSYANNFSDHDWADVNAVRVLSEGVS